MKRTFTLALLLGSAMLLADAAGTQDDTDIGFLRELDDDDVKVDANGKKVVLKGAEDLKNQDDKQKEGQEGDEQQNPDDQEQQQDDQQDQDDQGGDEKEEEDQGQDDEKDDEPDEKEDEEPEEDEPEEKEDEEPDEKDEEEDKEDEPEEKDDEENEPAEDEEKDDEKDEEEDKEDEPEEKDDDQEPAEEDEEKDDDQEPAEDDGEEKDDDGEEKDDDGEEKEGGDDEGDEKEGGDDEGEGKEDGEDGEGNGEGGDDTEQIDCAEDPEECKARLEEQDVGPALDEEGNRIDNGKKPAVKIVNQEALEEMEKNKEEQDKGDGQGESQEGDQEQNGDENKDDSQEQEPAEDDNQDDQADEQEDQDKDQDDEKDDEPDEKEDEEPEEDEPEEKDDEPDEKDEEEDKEDEPEEKDDEENEPAEDEEKDDDQEPAEDDEEKEKDEAEDEEKDDDQEPAEEDEEKDDDQEPAEDDGEEKDDGGEEKEGGDDEGEEKEGGEDEGEEKEGGEEGEGGEGGEGGDDKPEEIDCSEDPEECKARLEEQGVGLDASGSESAGGKSKKGQVTSGEPDWFDPENDPVWYKQHQAAYPCYKITEQALFNFQLLKNLDDDWKATDPKTGETISFNLCHYTDTSDCEGKDDAFAFRTKSSGQCEMLTSDTPQAEVTDLVSKTVKDEDVEGIRLLRGGGDACPQDDTRLLSFTLDVWCNPDAEKEPQKITYSAQGPPDEEADPCNIYVSLEHEAGCPAVDLTPFMRVLGAVMVFVGLVMQYFGEKAQRHFLKFMVGICTFAIVCGVAYKLNWFAILDPTEPASENSILLTTLAFALAIIATLVVRWAFKKTLRLAPTVIGLFAGYWFSIYLIVAINGIGGLFVTIPSAAGSSADVIGPWSGALIELSMSALGALVGYNFSLVFVLTIQTFVSAYLIVRGTTLWINLGFPNEIALMQSATTETNNLVKLPPAFYMYSLTILAIWLISLKNQIEKHYENGGYDAQDEESD